jgi:formylmethanofuran dehydrogenase subunit E
MSVSSITQTPGGKIGIGVLILAAVGALAFEITHMNSSDGLRNVPAQQVVSEAQQQIDAINKMTNLTAEQKKAMIAHEQGEIAIAKGSGGKRGAPPAGTN